LLILKNLPIDNTFQLNSVAEYGAGISSHDDYLEILSFRKKHRVGLKVVGEGSNIIPRRSVQGLVVKMIRTGISQLEDGDNTVLVEVSAGENWNDFVFFALEKGWYGLENLVKIPGSVGAAPIQNIGAYGAEVADFIEYVLVWDAHGRERKLSRDECLFGYRSSIFQRDTELTVAGVGLRLGKIPKPNISYPEVRNALSGRPETSINPKIVALKIAEIRAAKLPDPKTYPNVGSFFKNPLLDEADAERLREIGLKVFSQDGGYKISAAELIDRAGCKDLADEHVYCWPKQPLVLINKSAISSSEVRAFAEKVRSRVLEKFRIRLTYEPRFFE
jgi:UDP-N-acetylmuramate dehydrogenase